MQAKDVGGLAEMAFMLEATKRSLHISKPVIDNRKYDYIVESSRLYKVQVKGTTKITVGKTGFTINTSSGSTRKDMYTKEHIDFFAFYIIPIDTWYIVPVMAIDKPTTRIYPHLNTCKMERYKEAWYQLK